jgi:hypothetical protein
MNFVRKWCILLIAVPLAVIALVLIALALYIFNRKAFDDFCDPRGFL